MHIAYVDESGNLGNSLTYTLACVIVPGPAWPEAFDAVIGFRRLIRDRFKVPVRAELRANYLIGNRGAVFNRLGLPEGHRQTIYRMAMRMHAKIGAKTFAVVIRKAELHAHDPALSPRDVAWDYLLQRLRTGSLNPPVGPTHFLLMHDEGEEATIRGIARKARRAGTAGSMLGTGRLSVPFTRLVDDPVARKSDHSYFIQLADLAAFAAFRRLYRAAPRAAPIVPQSMWDELGEARYEEVTRARDPIGIVHWPAAVPPPPAF